jgi:hypothetical protein
MSSTELSGVHSFEQWHKYYELKADSYIATTGTTQEPGNYAQHDALLAHLQKCAKKALSARGRELKESLYREALSFGPAALGSVPFVNMVYVPGVAMLFGHKALRSMGLDRGKPHTKGRQLWESAVDHRLKEEGMIRASLQEALDKAIKELPVTPIRPLVGLQPQRERWKEDDMAAAVRGELYASLTSYILFVALDGLARLIPIPLVGNAWSRPIGYFMAKQKLDSMLKAVEKKALEVHSEILVPIVVHEIMCVPASSSSLLNSPII